MSVKGQGRRRESAARAPKIEPTYILIGRTDCVFQGECQNSAICPLIFHRERLRRAAWFQGRGQGTAIHQMAIPTGSFC